MATTAPRWVTTPPHGEPLVPRLFDANVLAASCATDRAAVALTVAVLPAGTVTLAGTDTKGVPARLYVMAEPLVL